MCHHESPRDAIVRIEAIKEYTEVWIDRDTNSTHHDLSF
jgi:hypothetical protein